MIRIRGGRTLVTAVALGVGLVGGGALGLAVQGRPLAHRQPTPAAGAGSSRPSPSPSPSPAPVRLVTPDTLLAWTPGGLPPGLGAGVKKIAGVDHAVAVVSGTAWMTRSLAADGTPVDRPPSGLAIPIEVAGADLADYEPFLSPADRTLLPALDRGEALLGASSAALRHLGPGASLLFGSIKLHVAGVVADAAIGAHELFVSRATAGRLKVRTERYLLIDPGSGASRKKITSGIRALLPPGGLLRVRGPGETPFFRQGDAVLSPIRLKELFGEFAARPIAGGFLRIDPAWVATHIVTASVPILGHVQCNRALIPQLRGALADVEREGLAHLIDPAAYAGCYSGRFVNRNPEAGISHHAWGAAVDINVATNAYGHTPHQDPRVVAIFERWGFTWGGEWLVPDGMHFEFVRFPTGP